MVSLCVALLFPGCGKEEKAASSVRRWGAPAANKEIEAGVCVEQCGDVFWTIARSGCADAAEGIGRRGHGFPHPFGGDGGGTAVHFR